MLQLTLTLKHHGILKGQVETQSSIEKQLSDSNRYSGVELRP